MKATQTSAACYSRLCVSRLDSKSAENWPRPKRWSNLIDQLGDNIQWLFNI